MPLNSMPARARGQTRSAQTTHRLYAAGANLLAVLPQAMVLANRSSPAVIGLAALAYLAARWVEDRRSPGPKPAGAASDAARPRALAFLAWCLVSFAWTPFPAVRRCGCWASFPAHA